MPGAVEKAQSIRLLDVYALGPFMLYAALKPGSLSSLQRLALAGIGITTILYNLKNYREQAALEQPQPAEIIGVRG